jgi:hypothetical protein
MLLPYHYKLNDLGFLTNNWVLISNELFESVKIKGKGSFLNEPINKTVQSATNTLTEAWAADKLFDDKKYYDVLLFDVEVSVSKSPLIISTPIKGFKGGTIKQQFNQGDAQITISGILNSPTHWHTDVASTTALNNLASLGQTLFVTSPYLNVSYGISQVVITNLSISTVKGFPSLLQFSLELAEDSNVDIINLKSTNS